MKPIVLTRTDEDPSKIKWVKLLEGNSWMHLFIMHPKCESAVVGMNSTTDAIAFKDGDKIRVKWGDALHRCSVHLVQGPGGSYGDMGHTYDYDGSMMPWTFVDGHLHPLTDLDVAEEDLPPWKAYKKPKAAPSRKF